MDDEARSVADMWIAEWVGVEALAEAEIRCRLGLNTLPSAATLLKFEAALRRLLNETQVLMACHDSAPDRAVTREEG